ncbi:MAG: ComEC/Rec2 family competence protein [Lachnospiraceae bacterium]|nr:ComEC/Rec2 family competence protein [Lachnospiraceae bacterium]
MRRPFCLAFLTLLSGILFVLHFFYAPEVDPYAAADRRMIRLEGIVERKEIRTNVDGSAALLMLVRPLDRHAQRVRVFFARDEEQTATQVRTGQKVVLCGEARCFSSATNPGQFDALSYYRLRNIDYTIRDAVLSGVTGDADPVGEALFTVRYAAGALFDRYLLPEDAGMMRAIMLGDKSTLDPGLKELYARNQIGHLLSISGLHAGILGTLLLKCLKKMRLPYPVCAAAAMVFLCVYGIMCGMPLSTLRAIVMFGLYLAAPVFGRTYDPLSAMSLAGILLLIEQPRYAKDSVFLMSFGAICALGILAPAMLPLREKKQCFGPKNLRMRVEEKKDAAIRTFLTGLAVVLFTLPVQMMSFYTVSPYAVLLNLIVIPLMTLLFGAGLWILVTGSIGTLLSGGFGAGAVTAVATKAGDGLSLAGTAGAEVVSDALAVAGAWICRLILDIYEGICRITESLPLHRFVTGTAAAWQVVVFYLLVAIFVYVSTRMKRSMHRGRFSDKNTKDTRHKKGKMSDRMLLPGSMRYVILLVAVIVLLPRMRPALTVTMLDVGQGDAIVVRTGDACFLIDGGSTSQSGVGQTTILPYLKHEGIGFLDAVIISHEDADHVNGVMELMEDMEQGGIRIGCLMLPEAGRREEMASMCAEGIPETDRPSGSNAAGVRRNETDHTQSVNSGYIWQKSSDDTYRDLVLYASRLDIPVVYLSRGMTFSAGELIFTCLAPHPEGLAVRSGNANAHSAVLHMRYGSFTALFTGDVEGEGLRELNDTLALLPGEQRHLTLLKVAHHGSRFTTDERFLSLIDARLSLISCGRNNRYGHPHEELLSRLEEDGSAVFVTTDCGAVTVRTGAGGTTVTVETYLRKE